MGKSDKLSTMEIYQGMMKGGYRMNKSKVEDLAVTLSDLLKKEQVKEEKKCHPFICFLAIVGGIVAVAAEIGRAHV